MGDFLPGRPGGASDSDTDDEYGFYEKPVPIHFVFVSKSISLCIDLQHNTPVSLPKRFF